MLKLSLRPTRCLIAFVALEKDLNIMQYDAC